MNKISKIGLTIYLLTVVIIISLMFLGKKVPHFLMYLFWGGLIINFAGAVVNQRKDQLL